MSTIEIERKMMTALPQGYDAFQPDAKQPTATYSDFNKSLIAEQARPINMPHNKAMCDSSSSNYASGRLDYQTYYASLDIERMNADDAIMDQLFDVWFEYAVVEFGWLGGNPDIVTTPKHGWDWPKHLAVDIKAEAQSNHQRLTDGVDSLSNVFSVEGRDYEDELAAEAMRSGIAVEDLRKLDILKTTPQHIAPYAAALLGIEAPASPQNNAPNPTPEADEDDE